MATTRFVPMKKSLCPLCGNMARGGRHRKGTCPPSRGIRGEHRRRTRSRKRRARREAMYAVKRGEAVVGTGKPSASSKEK